MQSHTVDRKSWIGVRMFNNMKRKQSWKNVMSEQSQEKRSRLKSSWSYNEICGIAIAAVDTDETKMEP